MYRSSVGVKYSDPTAERVGFENEAEVKTTCDDARGRER